MLPEVQTDEVSEPSTKRNALTKIVECQTENYFDVLKGLAVGQHECHQRLWCYVTTLFQLIACTVVCWHY